MPWTERHQTHWRQNLRLTAALLLLWFVVTFVLTFFARELDFSIFGAPFGFCVAALGAPLVYVIIVACYARCMERIDRAQGLSEDESEPS